MSYLDIDQARRFVVAITGSGDTVCDFRMLHDKDKSVPGVALRGTLDQVASSIELYQSRGYGAFMVINQSDGTGLHITNMVNARAHFYDYDVEDSEWQTWRAANLWVCPPTFMVSGAILGKHHAYWALEPYALNDGVGLQRFEMIQRKLVTQWQSDPPVIDAPRVMRLPGSCHLKGNEAIRVVMHDGSGYRYKVGQLEHALINVSASGGTAERVELGDASKAAPSFDWAVYALNKVDPGTMDRLEWLKLTAAFKTAAMGAGADEPTTRMLWDMWCARYPDNNLGENEKLWASIRDTKTGWSHLERTSGVAAERMFGGGAGPVQREAVQPRMNGAVEPSPAQQEQAASAQLPIPKSDDERKAETVGVVGAGSEFLTPSEQAIYFRGCVFIENMGRILTPSGRFMDSTKFNATFGGKKFILSNSDGAQASDEAWKAATRGQAFNIPKVDSIRFLPYKEPGEIFLDELGRSAVNTYKPPIIKRTQGDVRPFLDHLEKLLPIERDRLILLSFMAHCVQRPGRKAFWAPVIQSAEGAGKNVFKYTMQYALGAPYVYFPKSAQLVESGGKFNAWMRSKLLIIADEIRTDEQRKLIEMLKDIITEERTEVEGKGADQDLEDNVANWMMFTNWQDAIPITEGARRYAIFYSQVQDISDFHRLGMIGDYFPKLYAWLREEGAGHMAQYLLNFMIPHEFDPMGAAHRAPITSSTGQAVINSRTRIEQLIMEAVETAQPGFRGGWLSSAAVTMRLKAIGERSPSPHALSECYKRLGYKKVARANKAYAQEDFTQPLLWNLDANSHVGDYARLQGYE